MNKRFRIASLIALFALVIGLSAGLSLQAQAKKLCCVAGEYEGFQIAYAKPNCPAPVKEIFKMAIKQAAGCGADVKGTVTDPAGMVSNWTGTLSRGASAAAASSRRSFLTPGGNTVEVQGHILQKAGKWHAEGTWEEIGSTDRCKGSGTWQINQI